MPFELSVPHSVHPNIHVMKCVKFTTLVGKEKIVLNHINCNITHLFEKIHKIIVSSLPFACSPFRQRSNILPKTSACSWFNYNEINWRPPKYSDEHEIPYIPKESTTRPFDCRSRTKNSMLLSNTKRLAQDAEK